MGELLNPIWESRVLTAGQQGFSVEIGPATFTTTALTTTLKTHMQRVLAVFLTPAAASINGESLYWNQGNTTNGWYTPTAGVVTITRSAPSNYWTVPAGNYASNTNGAVTAQAPLTGVISAANLTSVSSDPADDDSNLRSFGIINQTQTLTPVNLATAANTTASTGGVAVVAYTPRVLTLAAAGQLGVTAGDTLEFTVSDTGTGVVLNGVSWQVTIAGTPTTGLAFQYLIIGQAG